MSNSLRSFSSIPEDGDFCLFSIVYVCLFHSLHVYTYESCWSSPHPGLNILSSFRFSAILFFIILRLEYGCLSVMVSYIKDAVFCLKNEMWKRNRKDNISRT